MEQTDNSRILKNTVLLYVRMIVNLFISLFTTRVIFQALGLADMGLYNLVGSILSMIGFLNNSMSGATNRFLSFELGKKDQPNLNKTFKLCFTIHCLLALIIFILGETIGLWFNNTQLVIDPSRIHAANWVYQVAIISTVLGIVMVPFTASIMSHEKMGIFAYFSFIDVAVKLLIVYALWYIEGDKLIVYSLLLLGSNFIYAIINIFYTIKHFHECRFGFYWDKECAKSIMSFSGWNLFGQATIITNEQVLNVFLNWFFGTVVNGARSITNRISSMVSQFVNQFQTAIKPAIIKKYAAGDINSTKTIMCYGIKLSYLMMMIISFPVIIETESILKFWLGSIPEYTVWFIRLTLLHKLVDSMTGPIQTAIQATGNIMKTQIYVSIVLWSILPLSYLLLYSGSDPYLVMLVYLFSGIITLWIRIIRVEKQIGIESIEILKYSIAPCILSSMPTFIVSLCFYHILSEWEYRPFFIIPTCFLSAIFFSYFFALNVQERKHILNYAKIFISQAKNKR